MMDDQLDPREKLELAMLRAEHQKKFQMMINYVKEGVGEGDEYSNGVARMVISKAGAYYELIDLPEEFVGALGSGVEHRFISQPEAMALLEGGVRAAKEVEGTDTRLLQVMALYSRRGLVDRKNCYLMQYKPDVSSRSNTTGAIQPGVMPLFFKIKVDSRSSEIESAIGANRCILLCLVMPGDRYPLIRIQLDREETTDLGSMAASRTIQ
jgi:hypothetical protein